MRPSGMTVIELLVGLTVTALAAGAGYTALATVADHRGRAREAVVATARAAGVRRALVAWLGGAYVATEEHAPPFQVVDHVQRGRADDEVTFLTSAQTPLGAGDVVVRLFVDRDDRTPERGLTAEFVARYGARVQRLELDSSIVALDVRSLSEVLGKREWMRTWLSAATLPQGVELRFGGTAADRLAPLLRVPVTVALLGGR